MAAAGVRVRLRWRRLIWTVLVSFYFMIFAWNLFNDALPGNSSVPIAFFFCFTLWMAVEYYFGSPFFQSGIVEAAPVWKSLFAIFFYPFLGYCVADYTWSRWTQIPFVQPYLNVLGIMIFAGGSVIRLSTLFQVLRAPAGRLIRSGLFRQVRHPRYLGTLVQMIAIPLVFGSWLGLVLAMAVGLPLILAEIRTEERGLLATHPDEYVSYQQAVPALIPGRRTPAAQ